MRALVACLLAIFAVGLAVFLVLPIVWLYVTTVGEFWFG